MKKFIVPLTIVLTVFSVTLYAGDDKKAIAETIDNELKAYLEGDYDSWADYWVHETYVSQFMANAGFFNSSKSWDSLSIATKKSFEKGDNKDMQIEKGGYDIHVSGDMALVYAKVKTIFNFLGVDQEYNSVSVNVLKKDDKKWKFVSMNTIVKSSYENTDDNTEMLINFAGYKLLLMDQIDNAIKVFTMNTELYPDAFNTWDSLAEAFMIKGDKEKAIKYYKKSIELNEKNTNAQKMIEKMEKEE